MKKRSLLLLTAAAALCMASPAAAKDFTSPDGILSMELPGDDWVQLQDHSKWISLSDGADLITIEHFANGERLPEIQSAGTAYAKTVTTAYTTANDVYIATGFAADEEDLKPITEALMSIHIKEQDTPAAPANAVAAPSEFSITQRAMKMFVTANDSLHVRSGFSTESPIIGELGHGAAVRVTGAVLHNGSDYGWYQIAFKNGSGFVSAAYLSPLSPDHEVPANPAAPWTVFVNLPPEEVHYYIVFSQLSGQPIYLIGNDGIYYDGSGDVYYLVGGGIFVNVDGLYYSITVPDSAPDTVIYGVISEDESGRPAAIYEYEDGTWIDEDGNLYYLQEDGTFQDENDTVYIVQVSGEASEVNDTADLEELIELDNAGSEDIPTDDEEADHTDDGDDEDSSDVLYVIDDAGNSDDSDSSYPDTDDDPSDDIGSYVTDDDSAYAEDTAYDYDDAADLSDDSSLYDSDDSYDYADESYDDDFNG